MEEIHRPVMPRESLELLGAVPMEETEAGRGRVFVDATLGLGGHTELILAAAPGNRVLGLDRDAEAIALAQTRLSRFGSRFQAVQTDYRSIKQVLSEQGIESVAGILADLGVSSFQFDTAERGFSFRSSSPLDMRMDRSSGVTAAELVNTLTERELADLIYEFGEERAARRIARRIIAERARTPVATTTQLAELVIRAINQRGYWKIHPATRTFQALRIAVNRELEGLDTFAADAVDLLEEGGRLAVITFHSLEDRIIKQAFRFLSGRCLCPPQQPECRCGARARVEVITRKAIQPSEAEITANPRARSAKLRGVQKLANQ